MLEPGVVLDIGNHTVEVLESPAETGDRYRLRIVAEPGGPGVRGRFPHVHAGLIETFRCVSGQMKARVGRDITEVAVGEKVTVNRGKVHGFLNTGADPLVIDNELIFPGGYRSADDLMTFASIYDHVRRVGPHGKGLLAGQPGEPPLLQMAVLVDAYRNAINQPGLAGLLIRPLAVLGRMRGYRATMPG